MRNTYHKAGRVLIEVSRGKGNFVAKVLVFPRSKACERYDAPDILYGIDMDELEALKRLAEKAGVDWSSVLGTTVNGGGK